MKRKRLMALLVAAILCIGLMPQLTQPLPAYAAALTLHGGNNPNCLHANTKRTIKEGNAENHLVRLDCPDCGGWAEYEESHTWVAA